MEPICLRAQNCVFLMIDMQEKLVPAIEDGDRAVCEAARLMKCAQVMNIPVLVTEQYPKGLGGTVEPLRVFVNDTLRISKTSFSCFGENGFAELLARQGRRTVVVFGVESHICLFSTAMELRKKNYQTIVAEDACGSRKSHNHELAMQNLLAAGVGVLPTETVVYQLLQRAGSPEFKALLPLFKN